MIIDEFYKNIVILGSNGTGISAALKLSRLFRSHYNVKIYLISNNFNVRNHIALRLFSKDLKQYSSASRIKKNLEYHVDNITDIDLKSRKVYLGEKEIYFQFLVVNITDKYYHHVFRSSLQAAGKSEQIIVDDSLREVDMSFIYFLGDNAIAKLDTGSLVSAVNSVTQKQEKLIAQNIYNEVYGYNRIAV